MKKLKVYSVSTQSGNDTAAKGSASNPYTQKEYETMLDNDTWPGGYVKGLGYCLKGVTVTPSSSGSGSGSWGSGSMFDSWDSEGSSWPWDSSWPNNSNYGEENDEEKPKDHENNGNNGSSTNNRETSSNVPGSSGKSSSREKEIYVTGKVFGISAYSYNLLKTLPYYSGNIHITSVARTPEEQAKAMLNNIKKNGVQSQLKIYRLPGQKVILTYNKNLSDEANLRNMIAKILEEGPTKVSKHCADFSVLNVFDVSRRDLSNVLLLIKALKAVGIDYIDEPQNGCVHIEIPQ